MESGRDHDQRLERRVALVLRAGVVLSALLVLAGACVYLARRGGDQADYRVFRGEPEELRHPDRILDTALNGSGRGLIQLGLLVLLATPLCRVAVMFFFFLRRRNWTYTAAALLVLAGLCLGLFAGAALH